MCTGAMPMFQLMLSSIMAGVERHCGLRNIRTHVVKVATPLRTYFRNQMTLPSQSRYVTPIGVKCLSVRLMSHCAGFESVLEVSGLDYIMNTMVQLNDWSMQLMLWYLIRSHEVLKSLVVQVKLPSVNFQSNNPKDNSSGFVTSHDRLNI